MNQYLSEWLDRLTAIMSTYKAYPGGLDILGEHNHYVLRFCYFDIVINGDRFSYKFIYSALYDKYDIFGWGVRY